MNNKADKEKIITRFIYMGDPQCSKLADHEGGYGEWGKLLRAAREHEIQGAFESLSGCTPARGRDRMHGQQTRETRLLMLGGDIVNRGDKETEWQDFLAELSESGIGLTVATPVTGSEASAERHGGYFNNPGNGPMGYEKNFFSFDHGCCHFIVLDSDYMGNRGKDACKYIGYWIKADLAVNTKPVTIAVMHHPMFTVGESVDDDVRAAAMRKNYLRLLHKHGVDFILCGHQHAYSRTSEITEDGYDGGITQVMGVSGTKYFDAEWQEKMECGRDHISVATVFETDGEHIVMETIDGEGKVIDRFEKQARRPKHVNCGACRNFAECRGTGKYEKAEADAKAGRPGDPLRPGNLDGIVIQYGDTQEPIHFSDEQIKKLNQKEIVYSIRYKDGIHYESRNGFLLEDLLESSGCRDMDLSYDNLSGYILILTSEDGRQRAVPLAEVLWAGCYDKNDSHKLKNMVPAMIFEEDGGYRLAFGQKSPMHFNGRMWARNIRKIEITPFDT